MIRAMPRESGHLLLVGPILNLCSPQSKHAPALFQEVLLKDQEYMERIQRHYRMFREAIDGKAKEARQGKRKAIEGSKHSRGGRS